MEAEVKSKLEKKKCVKDDKSNVFFCRFFCDKLTAEVFA